MVPAATPQLSVSVSHPEIKKQSEASQLANPFYSPALVGGDKDESYKYARYKVIENLHRKCARLMIAVSLHSPMWTGNH